MNKVDSPSIYYNGDDTQNSASMALSQCIAMQLKAGVARKVLSCAHCLRAATCLSTASVASLAAQPSCPRLPTRSGELNAAEWGRPQ